MLGSNLNLFSLKRFTPTTQCTSFLFNSCIQISEKVIAICHCDTQISDVENTQLNFLAPVKC